MGTIIPYSATGVDTVPVVPVLPTGSMDTILPFLIGELLDSGPGRIGDSVSNVFYFFTFSTLDFSYSLSSLVSSTRDNFISRVVDPSDVQVVLIRCSTTGSKL